jgi:hypothetical protein
LDGSALTATFDLSAGVMPNLPHKLIKQESSIIRILPVRSLTTSLTNTSNI